MVSLIAFAWRKSLGIPPSKTTSDDEANPSINIQPTTMPKIQPVFHDEIGISTSSSGETLSCLPNVNSVFRAFHTRTSPPSVLDGPYTPEALKVRKSPQDIRAELGLPPKRLYPKDDDYTGGIIKEMPYNVTVAPILPPMPTTVKSFPSPQVSMGSFYPMSWDSCEDNIARSPSLRPGEARTAVGALLSMNDDIQPIFIDSQPTLFGRLQSERSILPSREWLKEDRSVDEANDFSIELPYELLNETRLSFSGSQIDSVAGSSIHSMLPDNLPNTSFTRAFLENTTRAIYDFGPIVKEEVPVDDLVSNGDVSRLSLSTDRDIESMKSNGNQNRVSVFGEEVSREYLDRRETECLVLTMLERLRDDVELVSDILHTTQDNRISFAVVGNDDMFAGFSTSRRSDIVKALETYQKRYSSTSEPYRILAFCRSLVQASGSGREEDANALCPPISAFSGAQRYRWRVLPGLRAGLGLNEDPSSPSTIRGGDTSLFSLPSDSANESTPHTSNVSMTSTITSALSPDRNRYLSAYSNGERLRRTIDMLCISLSLLGDECIKLAGARSCDTGKTSKVIYSIQNIYFQLMMLPNHELKDLIDFFELDVVDVSLARVVSTDDDEESVNDTSRNRSERRPTANRRIWGLSLESVPYGILEEEPMDERDNADLFSPSTLDMMSVDLLTTPASTDVPTTDEDLRRTVGSFDSEDRPDRRDAPPTPPALGSEQQATRSKLTKLRHGFFRRRPFRRRQAAE